MSTTATPSPDCHEPTPDPAEYNAFFPSPYSLGQYVPPRTDFDGIEHPGAYTGAKKILMIGTEERYLRMRNGRFFSTGNHPVETLLPLWHLHSTGFEVEIATFSGNPVKLELWARPQDDEIVDEAFEAFLPQMRDPRRLSDVLADGLDDYLGLFVPGGHGATAGLPESTDVGDTVNEFLDTDRYIITLCHGPGALLAASHGRDAFPFRGYEMAVFPDALDTGANLDIGYIPGEMPWLVAERLAAQGVKVINEQMTGVVHRDRRLLTGDSPLASNELGKLAANTLLDHVRAEGS
jgi:molecular chaperone Hsp31 and glyoxalase 3